MEYESNNVYIVSKEPDNEIKFERVDNTDWEDIKEFYGPDRLLYVTDDVNDEQLKKYNFKTIIWDRMMTIEENGFAKVIIDFCNDEDKMEEDCFKKEILMINEMTEEYEKTHPFTAFKKENVDVWKDEFPLDMDDIDACKKWYKLGCPFPPPEKISQVKNIFPMSWDKLKEFAEFVYKNK